MRCVVARGGALGRLGGYPYGYVPTSTGASKAAAGTAKAAAGAAKAGAAKGAAAKPTKRAVKKGGCC